MPRFIFHGGSIETPNIAPQTVPSTIEAQKDALPRPEPYKSYTADEIVSLFGSDDEAQRLCNGQWLILPRTAVCLATIGEGPDISHFHDASEFYWVADQPYHVSDEPLSEFVPAQVRVGMKGQYAIHLFVRSQEAENYIYVGELKPSNVVQAASGNNPNNRGTAYFPLKHVLPSEVWRQLGGLQLGHLNFAAVDRALDRLRRPTTVQDRLGVLQELIDFWHGPIRPEHGMRRADLAGLPLPMPLRWWYGWAGKRPEVMSGQNILFNPRNLEHRYWPLVGRSGHLLFYVENQWTYQWSTLTEGDDPPIFGRYERIQPWKPEGITLSEHLIMACLFEAILAHAKYRASVSWLDEERFAAIAEQIPLLPLGPWRWGRTRFFARDGAFMCAAENGMTDGKQGYSLWIGARTEHPLQFLRSHVDDRWECVAL